MEISARKDVAPRRMGVRARRQAANATIRKKRYELGFYDALCFVIPALMPLEVSLIGQLFISEFIILALMPYLWPTRRTLLATPLLKRIFVLGGFWFLGQIATDLIRGSRFEDFSRGWASIAFTLLDFAFVYLITDNKLHRLKILFLGYAVGAGLFTLLDSSVGAIRWKMGGGDALLLGAFALVSLLIEGDAVARRAGLATSAVGSVLSLLFDARNNAGRGIVNVGLLVLQGSFGGRRFTSASIRQTLLILAVLALPVAYVILSIYGAAAASGIMGEKARETYAMQSNANFGAFGVLLGGRAEIMISTQAIADSPIIGHGSWAKSLYYYLKYRDLALLGFDVSQTGVNDPAALMAARGMTPEIPSHSILFQSWVWAGIMGGVFWAYILYLTLRMLVVSVYLRGSIVPLVVHAGTLFAWDILYSPYGNARRFEAAVFITMIVMLLRAAEPLKVQSRLAGLRLASPKTIGTQ